MFILRATADVIRVITGSAVTAITCHVSAMEADNGTPPVVQDIIRVNTANITTATTTTIIDCTTANRRRNVKNISIANTDASLSCLITVQHFDGTTARNLWQGTLLAGEAVEADEAGDWTAFTSGGIPKLSNFVGPVDVQTFTGNGTWTKPTSFTPKAVYVKLWGAGGGGGAGASLATAVVAKGGAGGGAGCFVREQYLATDLGATVSVTVGTGGPAGAAGVAGAAGGELGVHPGVLQTQRGQHL